MMQHPARRLIYSLFLSVLLSLSALSCQIGFGHTQATPVSAKALLETCGIKGGLVVAIGCGNPALLADLQQSGPYLVHGVDDDPANIATARQHLQDRKLYGSVTVSLLGGAQLPFVDSLVNLIVVTDNTAIASGEMTRVLAPEGVIADIRKPTVEITRKDRPAELDDWTHYLYDATNNAVSKDTAVDPPRGLRWSAGPTYSRSHEHFASIVAMVTAGGRIFTVVDEGPISSVFLPPKWKLAARDAFSGVLLWKRPIANWESHLRGFRSGPPEIARRIVATADRLYVTLGYAEPVSVLDAATGKSLTTLAGTEGAGELLLSDDRLYVLADDMTAAQHQERKEWFNRISPTLKRFYMFPRDPIRMYGKQRAVAIDTADGTLLWEHAFGEPGEIMPATMASGNGKICLQSVSHVVCLDAADGRQQWRSPRPVARSRLSWSTPTLVIQDGVVLSADRPAQDNTGKDLPAEGSHWIVSSGGTASGRGRNTEGEIVAFSLDKGRELWRAPAFEGYNAPADVFVIDGVVWNGNLRKKSDPGFTEGRDLKTGEVTVRLPENMVPSGIGHHRCYRNKATVRWLLAGRSWVEFLDPQSGTHDVSTWVRGTCQYGIMPANGLVYVPPHSCACNTPELLAGFNALSPRSSAGEGTMPLERGPAYGETPGIPPLNSTTDWPTYRCDGRRSGFQNLPAPGKVKVKWTRQLSRPITAPVAAEGLVLVAEIERHTLHALSPADGSPVWTFTADGRIDSPPTLYEGLCLFGTRNGFVYCLRASEGVLVWRFRAAPRDRRLFSYGQIESVWPVHGSVLVDDTLTNGIATAYVAAGRSASTDGGIRLYALAPRTGKVRHKAEINTRDEAQGDAVIRQKALPDILSVQKGSIWMRHVGVNRSLASVRSVPHLFAPQGFLDDTWWHRTYWMHDVGMKWGYFGRRTVSSASPSGRLLTFDGLRFYGYGVMDRRDPRGGGEPHPWFQVHVKPDATKDYVLFSEVASDVPALEEWKQWRRRFTWTARLPFVARSIVLARDALLVAGGGSLAEIERGGSPGTFWAVSRKDGTKMAACEIPASPVLDGMALTNAGVFVSAVDGSLFRLVDAR